MNEQPSRPTKIDQSGQTVLGNQTNIAGDLNTTWPRVATSAALVALLAFTLLFIELATNQVERLSGLSLRTLLIIAGLIAALAWLLALFILRKQRNVGQAIGYQEGDRNRPIYNQVAAIGRWSRRYAQLTLWVIPALFAAVAVAYYTWRVIPARYTTILLADFVAPSGIDEALVTQTLATTLDQNLAAFPTLRVKRLHKVIGPDDGSDEAKRLGALPQHKAAIVIWGNYAIVGDDPEMHLHFDIVQPADTYLTSGFATSYGPDQIKQPTMFDFKVSLGTYLGQMSAFTVGLTMFNANRYNEAIPFFETAAQAIDQPLTADFVRAIRFYRAVNYLALERANDAAPDLHALVPVLADGAIIEEFSLATLSNLGIVALLQGDYAAAKDYLQRALNLDTQLDVPLGRAQDLGNLGLVALLQEDYAAAKDYFQQALNLHTQHGDRVGQAQDLGYLGLVAQAQGFSTTALDYLIRSAALHQYMGLPLPPKFQAGLAALESK